MRLLDYMQKDLIFLDIPAENKEDAVTKIVKGMKNNGAVSDDSKFLNAVLEREHLGSTAIGKGVAVPHARTHHIDKITIAIARLENGIDFDAEDEKPVGLIFLLGTPIKSVGEYLNVLSRLSRLLKNDTVRKELFKAGSQDDILSIFKDAEN